MSKAAGFCTTGMENCRPLLAGLVIIQTFERPGKGGEGQNEDLALPTASVKGFKGEVVKTSGRRWIWERNPCKMTVQAKIQSESICSSDVEVANRD